MRISYSYGIIDLFHYGHLKFLQEAKKDCDLHIFGLVLDSAAEDWVGNVISNYEQRYSVLESVNLVDSIVEQKTMDPYDNLYELHNRYPDATITLYHGNDFKIIPAETFLNSIGGKVVLINYFEKMSPENILYKLNNRNSIVRKNNTLLSTKANTLLSLKPLLYKSKIEEIFVFTTEQFLADNDSIYSKIKEKFANHRIIARSSSSSEDCFDKSNAGHFDSVLNIDPNNKKQVFDSISQIVNSYKKSNIDICSEQILIQPMTVNVKFSGVVFTRELGQNRPYYLINYDDNGKTDSVTGGVSGKAIWISHDVDVTLIQKPWDKLLESVFEIRHILGEMLLDIEFAILHDNTIVIFQVRPLAANYKIKNTIQDDVVFNTKNAVKNDYRFICDESDYANMNLSDMAFWNPSEIIGSNPKFLDYSLYRFIITKSAWNSGLLSLGYTPVLHDLMYKIGNKPYISLEYTFMSLTPESLDKELRVKLMNYYIEKLKQDLSAHDKVEFEIVLSCYDFETDDTLNSLIHYGFTTEEINKIHTAIKTLTIDALNNYSEATKMDLQSLRLLEEKRREMEVLLRCENNVYTLINALKELLKLIKTLGTPQFSRQARYAFISRALCKTLVSKHYYSQEAMDSFMLNIETVATLFEKDFNLFLSGNLSKEVFNEKYGHLRAGTYDITAKRYDSINFKTEEKRNLTSCNNNDKYELNTDKLREALIKYDLNIDAEIFVNVISESITQREFFKFEFTKSLSYSIELIAKIGGIIGFSRTDLSYLEIADIYVGSYYDSPNEIAKFWATIIKQRKLDFKENSQLILPETIMDVNEIDFIHLKEQRPNFITSSKIVSECVFLNNDVDINIDISQKIVIVEKADPGFDWIFTQNIKGLITKYGGAASHMAIRCAEFGIPAAIGCGEKMFSQIIGYKQIQLDCKNQRIEFI